MIRNWIWLVIIGLFCGNLQLFCTFGKKKTDALIQQLDIGGGGGDIGNKNNHGGGDGGGDDDDDDDYFDDFDDGDEGDEGGLFRRRIVLQEVRNIIDAGFGETSSHKICIVFSIELS